MKTLVFFTLFFVIALGAVSAEAIVVPNPTTGESGFWLSRSDMEKAVNAMSAVPILTQEIVDLDKTFDDLTFKSVNAQRAAYGYGFFLGLGATGGAVGGAVIGFLGGTAMSTLSGTGVGLLIGLGVGVLSALFVVR